MTDAFGDCEGVVDLDPEMADGAFNLCNHARETTIIDGNRSLLLGRLLRWCIETHVSRDLVGNSLSGGEPLAEHLQE